MISVAGRAVSQDVTVPVCVPTFLGVGHGRGCIFAAFTNASTVTPHEWSVDVATSLDNAADAKPLM